MKLGKSGCFILGILLLYIFVSLLSPKEVREGFTISCTKNFSYTGGAQYFTVPAGVFEIRATLKGAAGGREGTSRSGQSGSGRGGYALGHIKVTPGSRVQINVGGQGGKAPGQNGGSGGWNGGGKGGKDYHPQQTGGGGGGGGTDIRTGSFGLSDRKLVAGGGGGSSTGSKGGGAGQNASNYVRAIGGKAGGQAAGGAAGTKSGCCVSGSGSFGQGGYGASNQCWGGGGGGGGWYGGGGGGCPSCHGAGYGSGGGGGSNYVGGATKTSSSSSGSTGNGSAKIECIQTYIKLSTAYCMPVSASAQTDAKVKTTYIVNTAKVAGKGKSCAQSKGWQVGGGATNPTSAMGGTTCMAGTTLQQCLTKCKAAGVNCGGSPSLPKIPFCTTQSQKALNSLGVITCSKCNTGYEIKDGFCKAVPIRGCADQKETVCNTCKQGYKKEGNRCVLLPIQYCKTQDEVQCNLCNAGYTLSKNKMVCSLAPITKCTTQKGPSCSVCADGYHTTAKFPIINKCEPTAISHCTDQKEILCSKCEHKWMPSKDKRTCVEVPRIKMCQIQNIMTCKKCVAGYKLDKNTCAKIPPPEQGYKGDAGEKGLQGIKGPIGLRGLIGDKGRPAVKGDVGWMGKGGIQGKTGGPGPMGYGGPRGKRGSRGGTGEKGPTTIADPWTNPKIIGSLNRTYTKVRKRVNEVANQKNPPINLNIKMGGGHSGKVKGYFRTSQDGNRVPINVTKSGAMVGRSLLAKLKKSRPSSEGRGGGGKMQYAGRGCCRWKGWKNSMVKKAGFKTKEECKDACMKDPNCVAADISRPRAGKYDCFKHYGKVHSSGMQLKCGRRANEMCYQKMGTIGMTGKDNLKSRSSFTNMNPARDKRENLENLEEFNTLDYIR